MYMITEQKPFEEILQSLQGATSVYLVGCGTCPAACRTGGKPEVLAIKEALLGAGLTVPGWMIIPTACDELAEQAIVAQGEPIAEADCLLVLACGLGVQNVARYSDKQVRPGLNTLFFGQRDEDGRFIELCLQCGECVLGRTAGICPRTACAKELVNGPCGGYHNGKCEVDPERPCAWMRIYDRLAAHGQADQLVTTLTIKDYRKASHPRRTVVVAQ